MTADIQPSPWWRHPFMWLVVGGPLAVVVAATATAVIAIRGADPVLAVAATPLVRSTTPALQARNHAATPAPAEP
jgi:hypothetical protein